MFLSRSGLNISKIAALQESTLEESRRRSSDQQYREAERNYDESGDPDSLHHFATTAERTGRAHHFLHGLIQRRHEAGEALTNKFKELRAAGHTHGQARSHEEIKRGSQEYNRHTQALARAGESLSQPRHHYLHPDESIEDPKQRHEEHRDRVVHAHIPGDYNKGDGEHRVNFMGPTERIDQLHKALEHHKLGTNMRKEGHSLIFTPTRHSQS